MPNEPDYAKEKRPPHRKRHNAQDDHEGAAHSPEEFDSKNPQKVLKDDDQAGSVRNFVP
ncbi:hypothetical protein [Sulfitobacter sp. 1A15299]|uniref:hypothetical protein n=1 Tax=Sulfitobacter sp. 1A15299 TaxID=3368598 RepID=UPI003746F3A8